MNAVAHYFDMHTRSVDRRYDSRSPLRGGPARGLDLAVAVVRVHPAASVIDVGCGTGRVGEAILDVGVSSYLGIDVSPTMTMLARERLARFGDAEVINGDFRDLRVPRTFDVVLALGVFEYLDRPVPALDWLRAHCRGELVASFTRFDVVKAPARRVHYALHGIRIVDYTEPRVAALLDDAGFGAVEFLLRGRRGFVVRAAAP